MEERSIKIDGQEYSYKLRRKKRVKYIRLMIESDGSLVVSAPKTYPVFLIKQFISSRWDWVVVNLAKMKSNPSILHVQHSPSQIKKYKEITRELTQRRLKYFNQYYQLSYRRISIRNQKTRWGSCSSDNNLNFNYRLCLLPSEIADYIIVHELCHLAEMNHSVKFWRVVEKTIPDYKFLEKRLKKI
ncbi:M48 family metallopeptidase [Candidatus Parcubacteria bacterium]|jgi:predicted metal-dependent hydrolase|nr:M48 family metallopeptidase [Candidatus Parcubacteria bacterium]